MKKLLLISLMCLFTLLMIAQDKVVIPDFPEVTPLSFRVDSLGPKGMFISYSKNLSQAPRFYYFYYSQDLEQSWQGKMDLITKGINRLSTYVIDPDTDVIYYLKSVDQLSRKKPSTLYITRISKDGSKKHLQKINGIGFWQIAFCDSKYLYLLSTENGWESEDKKKEDEKLHLQRFDKQTFSYKDITLKLPDITDPKNSTFWQYLDHDKNKIYLISKLHNLKTDECKYHIISINADGEIQSNISFEISVGSNWYLRPFFDYKYNPYVSGGFRYRSNDFNIQLKSTNHGIYITQPPSTSSNLQSYYYTYNETQGAFGNIKIDKKNNFIYIYGLCGPDRYKAHNSTYTGFFIQKYDTEGSLIWKKVYKSSKELAENKFFTKRANAFVRMVHFHINPDNSLDFEIDFDHPTAAPEVCHNFISADGALTATKMRQRQTLLKRYELPLENCYQKHFPDLCSYLDGFNEEEKKDLRFFIVDSAPGKVLFQLKRKENTYKLLYFKPQN